MKRVKKFYYEAAVVSPIASFKKLRIGFVVPDNSDIEYAKKLFISAFNLYFERNPVIHHFLRVDKSCLDTITMTIDYSK